MATLKGPHQTPDGVSAILPRSSPAPEAMPLDPRAVRVGVASASGVVAVEPIVVTPPTSAELPAEGPRDGAALRRLDAERAVLSRGDQPPERVLLLPPQPSPDGRGPTRREVVVGGWRIEVELEGAARAALRARAHRGREDRGHSGPAEVRAIIPGVVVSVSVAAGDEVVAGQQLLAVEAMKMQNELRAPRDGVIERVAVGPGRTIEVGDLLLVIA
jgi:biotin carboxyl carrier protein